ncbi:MULTISPECIES: HpcH/HpaI aldolase family protein [Alphaproteobacteria]|uniref:2,4-dihydroxyhept-2-ene-1,7-dioic acid aldolase n=2 Tax=Alphaproteobacteria TaxID=28211 RepID=A0A512HJM4_9HYPH|nr:MULTISPECIES: HpcH/HpaI aldolase/citrate lyase family protein [Alphaproteobacteria]GEO85657.1 2,4-dihydroxyhept-2-ene-1,7-dioic acid aldolase [Ciceribacter naphthalenivorans]GLR21988.1 2,4-dihydroxyhept-2-ene-1,7-dioic acid aldolase [Ciceribacter naphthalenivorans]GLT04844.1 2,4-dihydroxyhept-2-ene-1,7-dioic acid aldolase [Sphingomonas psychrolutea]
MPAPLNVFKEAILDGQTLYGLWVALASPHAAEVSAGSGFDWILIDAEHGPNDIPLIAAQLAAVARHPAHPVVRLPVGETWLIKQALDIGAQSLLVPMVETGDEAQRLARACRYPPEGIRGMGAGLGRAADFGRIADYVETANEQICLIVQIESQLGIDNVEAIVTTDGVDGVLIGPSDLAADLGHTGNPRHPEVMAAVDGLIRKIVALGKPAGIMAVDPVIIQLAKDAGACFIAVGSDVGVLAKGAQALLAQARKG